VAAISQPTDLGRVRVSTYGTVSALFWFVGLIPDLATLRDRATNKPAQIIYGMFGNGLARLCTALAPLSICVSLCWQVSQRRSSLRSHRRRLRFRQSASFPPGWHTTIFPPYFRRRRPFTPVFRDGLTIAIPAAQSVWPPGFHHDAPPGKHGEKSCWATGLIVAYGYFMEFFLALLQRQTNSTFSSCNSACTVLYSHYYFALILCNILTPQLLWIQKVRTNVAALFVMSLVINLGMWLEAFSSSSSSALTRDFVPGAWGAVSSDVSGLQHLYRHDGSFRFLALPLRSRIARNLHRGNARAGCAHV